MKYITVIKLAASFVAFTVLLFVSACGPDNGIVERKSYTPGYWTWITQCTPVGKATTCHPVMLYMPESFDLLLRPDTGQTDWRDVDSDEYVKCAVNDIYPECAK